MDGIGGFLSRPAIDAQCDTPETIEKFLQLFGVGFISVAIYLTIVCILDIINLLDNDIIYDNRE